MKRKFLILCSVMLCFALLGNLTGCGDAPIQSDNLMDGIAGNDVNLPPLAESFEESAANFSISLFQQAYADEKNTLVSPLSVLTALAMTANGADGETLTQMERVLGGTLSIEELNGYLKTFLDGRENTDKVKLTYANSIWFRDAQERLTVHQEFLQKNADYYEASVYQSAFDDQTLRDINQWVKQNTDGMIENALDEISPDAMLYLINTLVFDARWQSVYYLEDIREGTFTNISGTEKPAEMMHSEENKYLDDGKATGFIKNYAGGQYSFVALLPNQGVSLDSYVASLTGASFRNTVLQADAATVYAGIPKFSYDCSMILNDALTAIGMEDAFSSDRANFSKMGQFADGNLFINRVIHKTFISVDELGTKAGAVTITEMNGAGAPMDPYTVYLNRPFVYAIVDNATGIPVFMGAVVDLG